MIWNDGKRYLFIVRGGVFSFPNFAALYDAIGEALMFSGPAI